MHFYECLNLFSKVPAVAIVCNFEQTKNIPYKLYIVIFIAHHHTTTTKIAGRANLIQKALKEVR